MVINLTRFDRFRSGLPADSTPPRKYAEQFKTVQEFERLRTYLEQVSNRIVPAGDSEGIRTFRETIDGQEGHSLQARAVAHGKCVLSLDVQGRGVTCRYERYKGRQTWTLAGPEGIKTYNLTGENLKVQ